MNFILIDASYFIFYRVFALKVWWKNRFKEDPLDNPYENDIFKKKIY